MKKRWWFLIIFLILIIVVVVLFFTFFNRSFGECYKLRSAGETGVWYRILHKGMSCEPKPISMVNSQFCYNENRLEYKYCQAFGEKEKYDGEKLLCSTGNYFLLFNNDCENLDSIRVKSSCTDRNNDGVCCCYAFLKDNIYIPNLEKDNVIESSIAANFNLPFDEELVRWAMERYSLP